MITGEKSRNFKIFSNESTKMAQQRMQTTLKKTERHLQIKINSKSLHKFVSYFDRVQLI